MSEEEGIRPEQRMAILLSKLQQLDSSMQLKEREASRETLAELQQLEREQAEREASDEQAHQSCWAKLQQLQQQLRISSEQRQQREKQIFDRLSMAQHLMRVSMNKHMRQSAEHRGIQQAAINSQLSSHEKQLGRHQQQTQRLVGVLLAHEQDVLPRLNQRLLSEQQRQQSAEQRVYTQFADRLSYLKSKFELNCKHRAQTHLSLTQQLKASQDRILRALASEKHDRQQNEALALLILEQTIDKIQHLP